MSEPENLAEQVQTIMGTAEDGLQALQISPFTPEAYTSLKIRISEYVTDLVTESSRLAKRDRLDNISAIQVQRANERLVSSTGKRIFRHIGTIGGILLGAALSQALAMTLGNQYTAISVVASLILGVIGAFMVALHMATERD
jgi:hypothetical protein